MRWEKKKIDDEKSTMTRYVKQSELTQHTQSRTPISKLTYDRSQINSLKELLQQIGDVPKEKLSEALLEAQQTGKFIGEVLEEKGLISNDAVLSLLIKQCKIPLVSLLSYSIDREIIKIIPPDICEKYKILPIDKMGNTITLAMVNPMDKEAIEVAKKFCNGYQIRPILCSYKEFDRVKKRYFSSTEEKSKSLDSIQVKSQETPNSTQSQTTEVSVEENIPEAIIIDNESLDPVLDAKIAHENALLHTVFTEPISENTAIQAIKNSKEDLTIQDLATSMISSLQGSYELLIRRIKLFHGLTTEEIANLFAHCKQIHLTEGEVLFNKGDIGNSLYVLISGEIEIFDNDIHICYLSPGEMLGEMAVITKNKRSASARAVEDTVLLELDFKTIYRFIPPIVSIKLLTNIIFTLSERLTNITSKIQQISK